MPIAKMAEKLLCQRMGAVDEGQQVTEKAIHKFVAMFQGQLPDITVAALRALFNLATWWRGRTGVAGGDGGRVRLGGVTGAFAAPVEEVL
ncbi:hypothetical protein CFC21_096889 [Triticum aestivum]|uniref:Uncharacterized protein n=2 Tax=Triticum aestivum TaxID=4565 RepID=A0A9R1LT98_WHEAT|nr:hypothetical protein CFC21_096823 [Triticum aestivum]KAF7094584.1 hypothetical protein CFC21_096886 [Triticum aestivum]KAF7094587.1 hypothetical protein CFC21_096889 [Triticum aestivum]